MTKRPVNTSIILDDAASSAAEGERDFAQEGSDAAVRQTQVMPAASRIEFMPPRAETGLIHALSLVGEEAENDATQDAPRSTAEVQVVHVSPQPMGTGELSEKLDGKVLIIEDYPEVADVINVILRRMGFTTAHESHGARAFERYNEMIPDIVLLDLALPDITGWRVLDAIKERQREATTRMPVVIVMTAYGDPANRLVGKLQGVHAYLVKPFTAEELQRVVREAYNQFR